MKKVFSKTRDVCRIWATQAQDEARTGSNTWMRGDTLGNYGTPIARVVPDAKGKPVALVCTSQWSTTTAAVLSEAAGEAEKAGLPVYRVRAVNGVDMHDRNIERFKEEIEDLLDKLVRGRPTSVTSYRSQAHDRIATARSYAKAFGPRFTYRRNPDTVFHASEVSA
jgi:hypothetical protein